MFSSRRDYWTAPISIKSTRETRRSTSKPESFSFFDRQKRVDSVFVLTVVDHKGLMNVMGNRYSQRRNGQYFCSVRSFGFQRSHLCTDEADDCWLWSVRDGVNAVVNFLKIRNACIRILNF